MKRRDTVRKQTWFGGQTLLDFRHAHSCLMAREGDSQTFNFLFPRGESTGFATDFFAVRLNERFSLGVCKVTPSAFDPPRLRALTCEMSLPLRSTPLASSARRARCLSARSGFSPLAFCCWYSFLYGLGLLTYGMLPLSVVFASGYGTPPTQPSRIRIPHARIVRDLQTF